MFLKNLFVIDLYITTGYIIYNCDHKRNDKTITSMDYYTPRVD